MIRAKLITGGNQKERLALVRKLIKEFLGTLTHPDLLVVEPSPSVTINQIRAIKRGLAMKPYSAPVKIVLISEAEKITLPAQNALLKTLEEPPGEAIIFLLSPTKGLLLPTIVSRCQITQLSSKPEVEIDQKEINNQLTIINAVLKSGVGERVKIAERQSPNRHEAVAFCQKQLLTWRKILRKKAPLSANLSPKQIAKTLRQLYQSLLLLNANVNPRLVIENLLFFYPKVGPSEKSKRRRF